MDLKHLKALLKVLRENGVTDYTSPDLSLKVSHDYLISKDKAQTLQTEVPSDNPYANFPDGELTPEQLMFYSAGGKPEDDPQNQ
jgi:hypothetical protein